MATDPSTPPQSLAKIPRLYTLFFLYLEPLSALLGAYFAHFDSTTYLQLTHSASLPSLTANLLPLGTQISLTQLANLYLLFALNEAFVLRAATTSHPKDGSFALDKKGLKVWSVLLAGLLVADLGHLYSVRGLGMEIYWRVWKWNSMAWGNVGVVYLGALTRLFWLAEAGIVFKKSVMGEEKQNGEAVTEKKEDALVKGKKEDEEEVVEEDDGSVNIKTSLATVALLVIGAGLTVILIMNTVTFMAKTVIWAHDRGENIPGSVFDQRKERQKAETFWGAPKPDINFQV
ncbi:hypothetical protein MMC25_000957 [Agyrium rufum]|nr:hypothetical protein [Agyrium rufum]